MQVAVGLGNPGERYFNTRHNLGFRVVELLAERYFGSWRPEASYVFAEVTCGEKDLLLIKPTTFMNGSGEAVAQVIERFSPGLEDVMVVVDDVHLDAGGIRLRRKGSDGGHNGLSSIIDSLGGAHFPRLRMGVGLPPTGTNLIDFVLGEFRKEELDGVEVQIKRAAESIECWVGFGLDVAMNRYNNSD